MERLHDVPLGQIDAFMRYLSKYGMTGEDLRQALKHDSYVKSMVAALHERIQPGSSGMAGQLGKLIQYNIMYWEGQLNGVLTKFIEDWSEHELGEGLPLLYAEFETPAQTLDFWWRAAVGGRWENNWPDYLNRVRSVPQAVQYEPGLYLVHLDMRAFYGTGWLTPLQVREQSELPLAGAEVVAAHTLYNRLISGEGTPNAVMCGLDVAPKDEKAWDYCPSIGYNMEYGVTTPDYSYVEHNRGYVGKYIAAPTVLGVKKL